MISFGMSKPNMLKDAGTQKFTLVKNGAFKAEFFINKAHDWAGVHHSAIGQIPSLRDPDFYYHKSDVAKMRRSYAQYIAEGYRAV
jgi:hypothetical protein